MQQVGFKKCPKKVVLSKISLETLQKQFRSLTESGQLVAAEMALDNAQRLGLEQMACEQFRMEIEDHRKQAAQLIAAGDDLFRDEQYKEALDRYRRAQRRFCANQGSEAHHR